MPSKWIAPAFLAAAALTSALTPRPVRVTLAGRPATLDSVVVAGRTYVSLTGVQSALAAKNGAGPIAATEGGRGEWLFNGAWRLRVDDVAWNAEDGFWDVTVNLRNGTAETRCVGGNGLDPNPANAFHLATEAGNTLDIPLGELANGLQVELGYKRLLPGASLSAVLHFPGGREEEPPVKLVAEFTPVRGLGMVKDPSFRVDLTKGK